MNSSELGVDGFEGGHLAALEPAQGGVEDLDGARHLEADHGAAARDNRSNASWLLPNPGGACGRHRGRAPDRRHTWPNSWQCAAGSYLPFDWVLPKVDVFVTNGGYGSVNQAMSFGIPLVTAGLTEDKADVNARVAWSGVGIDLATNQPTPQALREAVRTVLDKPNYRLRASLMADEFNDIDTRSEVLRILRQVSHPSDEGDLRRDKVGAEKKRALRRV